MQNVCCVDVGGTSAKVGLLTDGDRFEPITRIPTPQHSSNGREVIQLVSDAVDEVCHRHDVDAVGVAVPGIVDTANEVAVWSANLGWKDVRIGEELRASIRLPLACGHDVRAGALAETRLGAGRGHRDTVFLALGTGVSAAIIADGRVIESGGWAGEIGHIDVGHTEVCACGNSGCLEAIASASAIAGRYTASTGRSVGGAADVAARARAGDQDADRVWGAAVEALGHALGWTNALFAPEVVVIGGGLAAAGDQLLTPLRETKSMRLSALQTPAIVPGHFGTWAGCVGAGVLAESATGPPR